MIDAMKRVRHLASPATLRRVWDSGILDPAAGLAALRAAPWALGRGPSLGLACRINATAYGAKEAIVDRHGTLTWAELEARANRTARALAAVGASPGQRVATLLRNGREQAEVILAAQKVGVVASPINTWARPNELRAVLEQTRPAVLVYDTRHADQVPEAADGPALVAVGDRGAVSGSRPYEEWIEEQAPSPPAPITTDRGSSRIVIHTSGTTGKPKGAARRTDAGEVATFLGLLSVVPYRREDVLFCPAPLFHSFGLLTFSAGMILGATMVLPDRFDPREALGMIEHTRATAASLVPVMIRRIVQLPDDVRAGHDVSSLRIVMVSGSALPQELRLRARDALGDVLYDLYGSTEAGWVAIATPEDMARRPGAVGRPVPGVDVAVLAPDGRRLPPGETGEIHVRSAAVFEGYTSGDSGPGRQGFLSLGDLGRVDDEGFLFVEGRADDMVVIGGENVYPIEVEEVIQGVPGVEEVAVVGVEDAEYGHALAAFVVGSADAGDIEETCRSELASFKVPRRIEHVDELPHTGTGKVRKRELVEA